MLRNEIKLEQCGQQISIFHASFKSDTANTERHVKIQWIFLEILNMQVPFILLSRFWSSVDRNVPEEMGYLAILNV
jgi:hypothetical protein